MSTAIVVRNLGAVELSITADAELRKAHALAAAKDQTEVTSVETQAAAAAALSEIKRVLKDLEASRTQVKAPVLNLGRMIDDKAKEFAAQLTAEANRIQGLIQTFYRKEAERAARARKIAEDLARKKREKAESEAAALAAAAEAAKTYEEQEELAEQAQQVAEQAENIQAKEVAAPAKAEKMTVRRVKKFRVTDIKAVYAARPEFCLLEERPYVINKAIRDEGMTECPGLVIWEEIDTTVRA